MLKASIDESVDLITMITESGWYDDPFLWVLVIIGIVVVPIVLTNLLIAIVGARYLEFEENNVVEDWREKAALCLEIEYYLTFCNRFINDPKLLFCISYCHDSNAPIEDGLLTEEDKAVHAVK